MIIPLLDPETFLMVRQYRYLHRQFSIEFPGGGRPEHLSSAEAAALELRGETGYTAHTLELLGSFNPCNGVIEELCSVFVARELQPDDSIQPDDTETFEVLTVRLNQFRHLVATGEIWDGMTLAAYTLWTVTNQTRQQ